MRLKNRYNDKEDAMTKEIEELIEEYALAYLEAYDNPRRLIKAKELEDYLQVSKECELRCSRSSRAEKAIFDFWVKGRFDELPEPAKEFVLAQLDRGCVQCWISSSKRPHPEHGDVCHKKIKNWFTCRTNLVRFGAENLLNRSAE